jgi:hypothetical protein
MILYVTYTTYSVTPCTTLYYSRCKAQSDKILNNSINIVSLKSASPTNMFRVRQVNRSEICLSTQHQRSKLKVFFPPNHKCGTWKFLLFQKCSYPLAFGSYVTYPFHHVGASFPPSLASWLGFCSGSVQILILPPVQILV